MIRAGVGFYIPCKQITFIGVYETKGVKTKVKKLKEQGTYLDLTRNKKTKSVIFYTDDAGVEHGVSSNFEVDTILKKIAEIKEKG